MKRNGQPCGRGHLPEFEFCANHRPRGAPKVYHPCTGCGAPTQRTNRAGVPMCVKKTCGYYDYQCAWRSNKRAKAREEATARIEAAKKEFEAQELDTYVGELLAVFDPASVKPAPPPPPAAWEALSESARSELRAWILQTVACLGDPLDTHTRDDVPSGAPSACPAVPAC